MVFKTSCESPGETTHCLNADLQSEAPSRKQPVSDCFQENTETFYWNSGQLSISRPISSFISEKHAQKKVQGSSFGYSPIPHTALHYLNFKQSEWTRIRSSWDEIRLSKGNSSKKWLPISTIEITSQYAIVLSTYSWSPLVFLWGKRDYLAGNTELMWRRGRERERKKAHF